ncbi:hypothetical protein [Ramlibacter alkalitolerans]|uniref:DUF4124 domain-containing protein n=1 Tax=Ramlibacter alkalitolerans TaxID=2039631 RepID=A0ABS1JNL3_9BURK|nr:hypothetical protein [Ramlibacter alkalitolerans]MBL0425852.1 hypothetical protein [Ramlibacter alkalitolerans]
MKAKIALLVGLLLAGANAMACYTVYDGSSRVVYQGVESPVDMSLPLHQALSQRFPRGAQMVFDQTANCRPVGLAQLPRPSGTDVPPNTIRLERTGTQGPSSSAPAPLFTERETAERANLPHTQVAGDIVVVPPAVAERAMHATVTVLPASTFAAATPPNTAVLGAGPAPARTGAARAPGGKPNVVITEMRDPPITVIETNGTRIISPR